MTGEGRRCERVAYPVRHCRHQRQLRGEGLQVQPRHPRLHGRDGTGRFRVPVRPRRPPRGGQGREDGRRRRRAGHPVQRPRTLLYQYVQPRGRKAAGQRPLSAPERRGLPRAGRKTHHLPLGQLRQTEPRSRPRKGAGHHAPCRGSAGRSRLRRYDSLPGDHGQDRPAGYAGRSIGPLRGGQAHHALHRLRPPERPDAGRHPVQGRLRRHPRPDG